MAIEAKDFAEKDELVAKFYVLRAGLSAVTEEAEAIDNAAREKSEVEYEDKMHRNKVALKIADDMYDIKQKYTSRVEKLVREVSRCSNECTETETRLFELKKFKAFKQYYKKASLGGVWLLLLIFIELITYGYFQYISAKDTEIVVTASVGVIITIILGKIFRLMRTNKLIRKERKKCKKLLKGNKLLMDSCDDQINKATYEMDQEIQVLNEKTENSYNKEYYSDLYKEKLETIEENFQKVILPYRTARIKSINQALHQQFDPILLESDWENVDLLIFYLSSGRADSLKEALLLVDRQRQTDQITHAIGYASKQIADTMEKSVGRLSELMNWRLDELINQIKKNHIDTISKSKESADAISHLSDSIRSLGSQLQSIESGIECSNQLLVDANTLNLEANNFNEVLLKHKEKSSSDMVAAMEKIHEYLQ